MARFVRFILRTTDVPAARAFYRALLGHQGDGIVELPAAARARGAPPAWIGCLGAADVAAATASLVARGGLQLGPGGDPTLVRDPGGAVIGLTAAAGPPAVQPAWHHLNAAQPEATAAVYRELFGLLPAEDIGVADVAGRPGVHTHWLFFFAVADVDAAAARVRELGGVVLPPSEGPRGRRIAVCDDPQGAAFGLITT